MSLLAFLLLGSSCACWTAIDLIRRILTPKMDAVALLVGLQLAYAIPLGLYGWLWAWPNGWWHASPAYWLPGAGSIALNLLGNWLFIRALALAPYSLVLPLLCLTPVFSVLINIPLLHELPSARQLAGVGVIVLGALWLNWPADARNWFRSRGSVAMFGVALCWALVGPCDKLATLASDPAFHGFFMNLMVGMGYALILVVTRKTHLLEALRPNASLVALGGLVGGLAIGLQLATLPLVMVGLFEAVKRMIGMLAAVILGRVLFREAITPRKTASIATMTLGLWWVLIK